MYNFLLSRCMGIQLVSKSAKYCEKYREKRRDLPLSGSQPDVVFFKLVNKIFYQSAF